MLKNNKVESRLKYIIFYTMLFALLMSIIFIDYVTNGTTLIGYNDSLVQHYPFLLKVKEFYENLFFSIFTDQQVELVDYSLYFGMNTIASLQYYGLGNPLHLFTMGWSEDMMPYVFSGLVILKIYLGGIAFSALCFQLGRKELPTLIGTLIYICNPFVLASLEQFCFFDVIYQLPLLVIGFNKILKGKKSKTFIVAVFLSALSGYYFLYMMTIMLTVYGVVVIVRRNRSIKAIAIDGLIGIWKTTIHYALGILLAAPVFIPSVLGLSDSYRGEANTLNISAVYDLEYYINELIKVLFYNSDTYFSLNVIVIFSIILLFVFCKKDFRIHKILVIISLVGIQVPIIGIIMNGFSYPTNRWLFGFYMVTAFVCVDVFSRFLREEIKSKTIALIAVCIGVTLQAYMFTSEYEEVCLSSEQIEYVKENSTSNSVEIGSRIDGDSEWIDNTSLFHNVSKAQIYTSVIPYKVMQAELDMDLASIENTNIISGLDSRAELQALFNISYYLTSNENVDVPYGFEKIEISENGKILFKNSNPLPFGYTYDSFTEESKLDAIKGIDKSWVYMDMAVVESEDASKINVKEERYVGQSLEQLDIELNYETDKIKVSFDNVEKSEIYIKVFGEFDKYVSHTIVAGDKTKLIEFFNPDNNWHIDREYSIYHIGYFENISEFYILGDYEYEKIEVYYHLVDNYKEQIDKLSKHHLEDVKFEENKISGYIEVPESRLLCMSVPAIPGWKAYIDGIESEIIVLNGMFIGLNIEVGEHDIVLKYITPGLKEGIILFAVAIIILFVVMLRKLKK